MGEMMVAEHGAHYVEGGQHTNGGVLDSRVYMNLHVSPRLCGAVTLHPVVYNTEYYIRIYEYMYVYYT